jgi:hypothetical protein
MVDLIDVLIFFVVLFIVRRFIQLAWMGRKLSQIGRAEEFEIAVPETFQEEFAEL